MRTHLLVGGLSLALLSLGCAKKNPETAEAPAPAGVPTASAKRSANVITADELSQSSAQNLYQAIQMLRPGWFRQRTRTSMGGTARTGGANDPLVVYLDNVRYGDVNSLKQLTTTGVTELRFYDPSEATNRYGTGHSQGAILVKQTR